ncbi:Flp pilus assembly complex ATPase component TadA [bacterium]|nr:Flp pilus assembly complex ATPase component TadA [bacterium]
MEDQGDHKLLGEILIAKGLINEQHLDEALDLQQESMLRIGEELIKMGAVDERDITLALSEQLNIPIFKIEDVEAFPLDIVESLGYSYVEENKVIPVLFDVDENTLTIVHHDPLNIFIIDDLEHRTGYKINFFIDTESNINRALKTLSSLDTSAMDSVVSGMSELEVTERGDDSGIDLNSAEGPIVTLVNQIISTGVKEGASDIHVEPSKKKLRIRYRKSGVLCELLQIQEIIHKFQPELISRLKLMANMDISEKRLPQDGRIKVSMSKTKTLDLRVNTLPTVGGEKICMRILDSSGLSLGLEQIGFSKHTLDIFKRNCAKPNGAILMTGPTGSGKTTTLYSALHFISTPELNICTVEDPVEYTIAEYNQTQIRANIGLTFGSALRALLRQDPDIILLGEMRDQETAMIGIEAAMTGHLVFSTLHTNSAAGAIGRLVEMGVPGYLVASTVLCIVAQRLSRGMCPVCRKKVPLFPEAVKFAKKVKANVKYIYAAVGCNKCGGTGYKGRTGIHESLENSATLRQAISDGLDEHAMEHECEKIGFLNLRADGLIKVLQGKIDEKELNRCTR